MSCKVLEELEEVIRRRIEERNPESYTYRLYSSGIPHICLLYTSDAADE